MTVEREAAADTLTGTPVAQTIAPQAGGAPSSAREAPHSACLNCGAALTGPYCAQCGQTAHIHRSFVSLGHDILHSVFHFDGKLWRTIPELLFHPGRLTRRYVEGERAKFVSPMALFLFTVFLMYAVFAFVPGTESSDGLVFVRGNGAPNPSTTIEVTEERIQDLRAELGDPELSAPRRAEIEQDIRDLESSRAFLQAIADGQWERFQELLEASEGVSASDSDAAEPPPRVDTPPESTNVFSRAIEQLRKDPELVLYKMKSNGYKWSWLLVPLSIPFMWLLFFWRREFSLYDHAVFVTYSISFMMLLLIVATLAGTGSVETALLTLVPPLHLYAQLRGAYSLSRGAAVVRLCFLLLAAAAVLAVFFTTLFLVGALE